jgi:hypothetical protein
MDRPARMSNSCVTTPTHSSPLCLENDRTHAHTPLSTFGPDHARCFSSPTVPTSSCTAGRC